jgi:hypothetical protein
LKTYIAHCKRSSAPLVLFSALIISATLTGCGGSARDCTPTALSISPATATASHLATPPGNQAQFNGFNNVSSVPSGCPVAFVEAIRTDLKWTVSDPVNVTIGNSQGVDYGVAICNSATSQPVTITATGPNAKGATISGTASLTCN